MTELARKLEGLLFVAGEAVLKTELAALLQVSLEELGNLTAELETALAEGGLALIGTETELQLVTHPALASFLKQFLSGKEFQLSRAASETLALVAYRGPITRYELDVLRGVDSRRILRQLVQSGFVIRSRAAGQTPVYDITPEFLKQLGLARKQELPAFDQLSSHAAVEALLQKSSVVKTQNQ